MDSAARDDTRRRKLYMSICLTNPLMKILTEISILPRHTRNCFGWLWKKTHYRYMHRSNICHFNAFFQNLRGVVPSFSFPTPLTQN